jgi:sugar phosphate isomerase/epimerase
MLSIGSNINEIRVDGSLTALKNDLDAFLGFGLNAAEITIHGLDLVRNGRCDMKKALTVKSMLNDFPFRISAHAPNPLNLMDTALPDLHRDVLLASLESASIIGAECLVLHPGRFIAEEEFAVRKSSLLTPSEKQALLDHEVRVLTEAADAYPEIIIAMENARPYLHHSPYCYAEKPDELIRQIRRINKPSVLMTLDFGHLHLSSRFYGFDELESVKNAAPYIAHCHVHDNFGRSVYPTEKIQTHQIPFGRGDAHMPVGWGDISFDSLFSPFITDYRGILICELRSRYFDSTGEAAETLRAILTRTKQADTLKAV